MCSVVFAAVLFVLPAVAQRFYITLGAVVAYLEIIGTALGLWKWAPESLGLAQANPPSGAVAGYLAVDGVAFLITVGLALPFYHYFAKRVRSTQKELTPHSAPALQ
jgi:membrane protein implicated in regulation of membrane protease activity